MLAGLALPGSLTAVNTAGRQWLDTVANVRIHRETRARPCDLLAADRAAMLPLPPLPADTSVTRLVRVTNRCRVTLDTNRYSVPHVYASQRLTLHAFADRLCLYHDHRLVATHHRSYERHRDYENPDHVRELLDRRQRARDAKWLMSFLALTPLAQQYHDELHPRHLNPRVHIRNIIALTEIHGPDAVAEAIRDAIACQAYSSQYIQNILDQRQRPPARPGPLHLTRRADMLELDLPAADLTAYEPKQSIHPTQQSNTP